MDDLFKQVCRMAYTGYVPQQTLNKMLDNMVSEERKVAEELVNKFRPLVHYYDELDFLNADEQLKNAKQSALICVEQLIKEHTWKAPIGWNVKRKKVWESVKAEIEKL